MLSASNSGREARGIAGYIAFSIVMRLSLLTKKSGVRKSPALSAVSIRSAKSGATVWALWIAVFSARVDTEFKVRSSFLLADAESGAPCQLTRRVRVSIQ